MIFRILEDQLAQKARDAEAADRRFTQLALTLGCRGLGRTWPNPAVGAVVVKDGTIIGRGWTQPGGRPHAEPVALREAGEAARGATLYVTLEPCVHHGKQPPCVDAIGDAGVARVVFAAHDPDPVAAGGAARLGAMQIAVESGVLRDPAERLNFRFLQRFRRPGTPFVTVKLAVSMDGRIADAEGRSQWISGAAARQWVHRLRAGYGAIAVGAATAATDHVRLTVRGDVAPRVPPVRVIFARAGLEPPLEWLGDPADGPAIVMRVGAAEPRAALVGHREVIDVADIGAALRELAVRGIDSVLVEGGGRLAGALLAGGLVDRVHQVQSPIWLGAGVPAWAGLGAIALADAPRWRTVERLALGDDTVLTLER